jgi:hypothetical protein
MSEMEFLRGALLQLTCCSSRNAAPVSLQPQTLPFPPPSSALSLNTHWLTPCGPCHFSHSLQYCRFSFPRAHSPHWEAHPVWLETPTHSVNSRRGSCNYDQTLWPTEEWQQLTTSNHIISCFSLFTIDVRDLLHYGGNITEMENLVRKTQWGHYKIPQSGVYD